MSRGSIQIFSRQKLNKRAGFHPRDTRERAPSRYIPFYDYLLFIPCIINTQRVSDTPLACIDFRRGALLVIFKPYVPAVINSIESMHSRDAIIPRTDPDRRFPREISNSGMQRALRASRSGLFRSNETDPREIGFNGDGVN